MPAPQKVRNVILSLEFCEKRAFEAETAATRATLDNVRDREQRSAIAWQALATQAKAVRDGRKVIAGTAIEANL